MGIEFERENSSIGDKINQEHFGYNDTDDGGNAGYFQMATMMSADLS